MPNQELLNFIRLNLQKGVSLEVIKTTLITAGWKESDIDVALLSLGNEVKDPVKKDPIEVPENLIEYISKQIETGQTKSQLAVTLKQAGWQNEVVQEAFLMIDEKKILKEAQPKEQEEKKKKVESFKELANSKSEISAKTKEISSELYSISGSFKYAFEKFRDNFITLIGIQIVPTFAISIIPNLLGVIILTQNIWAILGLSIVSFIIFVFILSWSQSALINTLAFESESFLDAYKASFNKIFPFIIVSLFLMFSLISGFSLIIVMCFVFFVWYGYATFIVVEEDKRGAKALATSREYTRNKFFYVLIRTILSIVIFSVFTLITTQIQKLLGDDEIVLIIWNFFKTLLRLIVTAFIMTFQYVTYSNLKKSTGEIKIPSKSALLTARIFTVLGALEIIGLIGIIVVLIGSTIATLLEVFMQEGISISDITDIVKNLSI